MFLGRWRHRFIYIKQFWYSLSACLICPYITYNSKSFRCWGQNQSRRNQCLKVSGKYFSKQKVACNFKRSYTTSSRIRRSNLFDKKKILGNKQLNGKRAYQRFPTVRTTRRRPKLGQSRPARHMANLACPDQLAIWRTWPVPTSSPYGDLGLSRPSRLMESSDCPDQLAMWRARTVPISSPYGELGLSWPARHMVSLAYPDQLISLKLP